MKHWATFLLLAFVLGLLTACDVIPSEDTPTPTTIVTSSSALIQEAWKALDEGRYADAIDFAQQCIDHYEDEAIQQQADLTSEVPLESGNKATGEAIFANWALNDVATAYFIQGRALSRLEDTVNARLAFEETFGFPDARALGQDGSLWSPMKEAQEELERLTP